MPAFLTRDELEAGLGRVRAAPAEEGTLELIVRRPALGARELLDRGELVKLSEENLPVGASFAVGGTVLEVTPAIHKGCGRFSRRFGETALDFVRSPTGRALRLRGLHARVVEPGTIRRGDKVRRTG